MSAAQGSVKQGASCPGGGVITWLIIVAVVGVVAHTMCIVANDTAARAAHGLPFPIIDSG